MKVTVILLLFALSCIFFNNIYAQEPVVMEQTIPNGKVKVQLTWPEVLPDQLYTIDIKFLDPNTNQPLDNVSITYAVIVTQEVDDEIEIIELYENQNTSTGTATFEVQFPDSVEPAQVAIEITSISEGSDSVQLGERVFFDVQVVPEFPFLSIIVMATSFMVVIMITKLKN